MTKWKYTRNYMLLNSQKNPHVWTVIINHLPLVTTWSSFWLVMCRRFRSMTINNLGIFKMNWDFRMLVFEDLKLGVTFEGKMSWSKRKNQKKTSTHVWCSPWYSNIGHFLSWWAHRSIVHHSTTLKIIEFKSWPPLLVLPYNKKSLNLNKPPF